MARPRKQIDWDMVDVLCGIQCTEQEICDVIDVDDKTLIACLRRDKHIRSFSEYYEQKRGRGRASLRRRQWKKATEEGDTTMLIFLGKQYLGQADKQETEIKGNFGEALANALIDAKARRAAQNDG